MRKTPILLVSGSRDIRPIHIEYYEKIVARALSNGWHIVAGDARGVDYHLAYAATAKIYKDTDSFMWVYGIQRAPRHGVETEQVLYVNVSDKCKTYTERDDLMLSYADFVYCIWDGKSKGTKRVYDKAVELGMTAWIKEVS